jgi:hypothetical protein
MPDIREITEEKIFKTLGRGVPMCTTLNGADANTVKSMLIIDQAMKQIPTKETEHIRGLEIIRDRQRLNLAEIRSIRKGLGCK